VSLEANRYMIALSEFPDGAPLEANTKLVGLVLAYHHNKQTRTAWPSMETTRARRRCRSRLSSVRWPPWNVTFLSGGSEATVAPGRLFAIHSFARPHCFLQLGTEVAISYRREENSL
jgi:hypothetical protein